MKSSSAQFQRFIGIDYSGAQTPTSSLKGLRIFLAEGDSPPVEIAPPPSPRKYWTRREVAHWVVERLQEDFNSIIGIDHGFSFPLAYFERHRLKHDWPAFLDDFCLHWPTDNDNMYVDFVRDGLHGQGALRDGDRRWRRLTELRARSAKSVFHFDVQGSVAKSTHAGLPWLKHIRDRSKGRAQFWPFDGWIPKVNSSVVVEVYPALWSRNFPADERTSDQHDAWSVAEWLRRANGDGSLASFFEPRLTDVERSTASIEGWILGLG